MEAIRQLGDYRWALDPDSRIYYGFQASNEVDCQAIVAGYDRIVALLPAEVPGEPEPVRAARAVAYQGVTRFVNAATPWTNSCREKLASGETVNIIQRAGYRDLMTNLESVDAPWNEAFHMLEQ